MSSQLESQAPFESTILGLIYRQFTTPKHVPAGTKLDGQTAIVTGSNTGLGLAASRQLLKLGLSHLIMAVRSQTKGEEAAGPLRKAFPSANVSVWNLDMQSYDSIRAFVERCKTLPRIDIAILNAALIKSEHTVVPETGHELLLQVDYLSTALLAILLVPVLKPSESSRVDRSPPVLSIVGSDLVYLTDIQTRGSIWGLFDAPEKYDQFTWYGRSKLLLVLFMSKLAEVVDPDDVIVNMPNPGACKGTSWFREFSTLASMAMGVIQLLLARTADVGATTYIDAVAAKGKSSHGSFVSDWTIKPYPKLWYTTEGQQFRERLWEETLEELNFAGASKLLESVKRRD